MTAQLPSPIATRRIAYAEKLMQRRRAVKVRRVRALAMSPHGCLCFDLRPSSPPDVWVVSGKRQLTRRADKAIK